MKKSGHIREIDYSHGTIVFQDGITDEYYTCTWTGQYLGDIGSYIVAEGDDIDSFEDASSYEPNSAKLISSSSMKVVLPVNAIG